MLLFTLLLQGVRLDCCSLIRCLFFWASSDVSFRGIPSAIFHLLYSTLKFYLLDIRFLGHPIHRYLSRGAPPLRLAMVYVQFVRLPHDFILHMTLHLLFVSIQIVSGRKSVPGIISAYLQFNYHSRS